MKIPTDILAVLRQEADRLALKRAPVPYLAPGLQVVALVSMIDDLLAKADGRGTLLLPNLRQERGTVTVFSDYGGEHAGSPCQTFSFLVCTSPQAFWERMKTVRNQYFPAHARAKEYAYKDLRFGPIRDSLEDYLGALDLVPGLLFTLVVDKDVGDLFKVDDAQGRHVRDILVESGLGSYSQRKDAEKMLTVIHCAAYLTALLSWKRQHVRWMTDHDAIAPNAEQHNTVIHLFSKALKRYSRYRYSSVLGLVPPGKDDTRVKDLLSAPDLAAGAISRVFQRKTPNAVPTVGDPATDTILQWLGRQGIGLKKHTAHIVRSGANSWTYSNTEFASPVPDDAQILQIVR